MKAINEDRWEYVCAALLLLFIAAITFWMR